MAPAAQASDTAPTSCEEMARTGALYSNPVGFMNLHPKSSINVRLNGMARVIDPKVLKELAQGVTTYAGFQDAMLAAAKKAELDEAWLEAALYYRAAEFYVTDDASRRAELYKKFLELHDRALPEVAARRTEVPYRDGHLAALDLPAKGEPVGVIVANSGFDGLIEEMVPWSQMLAEAGYRVILFEGPGQGGAVRLRGMSMTPEWEKPFGAVLDHFGIERAIGLGVSLGGYLVPRAAAYDPRIRSVIAWGAMYDFAGSYASRAGDAWKGIMALLEAGNDEALNQVVLAGIKDDDPARWGVEQGMMVSGAETPAEFFRWLLEMNLEAESARIKADTLIVMGSDDRLVPPAQLYEQAAALTNARSVTTRVFSLVDQGGEHCQIGNREIVVHEILRWLDGLAFRDGQQARLKDDLLTNPGGSDRPVMD